MRVFVGVPITEELKKKILPFQKEILSSGADVKLVSPEQLHFTLKFLGEIKDVNNVVLKLRELRKKKFSVEVKDVGVFPSEKVVHVVWAGSESEEFVSLVKAVQDALNDVRKEDYRDVVPHLTVARVRSSKNIRKLLDVIKSFKGKSFGTLVVDRFVLYESVLTAQGPVYKVVEEFRATDL